RLRKARTRARTFRRSRTIRRSRRPRKRPGQRRNARTESALRAGCAACRLILETSFSRAQIGREIRWLRANAGGKLWPWNLLRGLPAARGPGVAAHGLLRVPEP